MKVLKQINPKTRIIIKRFCWRALGTAIILQRKARWCWRDKAWIYPSIVELYTPEQIEDWLLWSEAEPRSPRDLALRIFGKQRDEGNNRNPQYDRANNDLG